MSLSMYDASIPVFVRTLRNLERAGLVTVSDSGVTADCATYLA